MPKKLRLLAPRHIELIDYTEAPLQPDQIRAEAVLSGISHGTEMNFYRGTSPFTDRHFDEELRLFLDGAVPAENREYLGYDWVGRITEVGAAVSHLKRGDLVHMLLPHSQTHTFVPENVPYRGRVDALPAGLSPEDAILLALAGVALQAVHDARIKVGDRVVIFGLGAIGLLAVQLAKLNGAAWVEAIDPIPMRRALAQRYGADRALDPTACDAAYEIKTSSPQHGADVAIELSGSYPALNDAIRAVRPAGLVVAGGFYQGGGTALRLGEEWHHNRVTMVSSMAVWDNPHRDYPLWDRIRVHAVVTDLLAAGRLHTEGLITHRLPFERAAEGYALIEEKPQEALKVVLTY